MGVEGIQSAEAEIGQMVTVRFKGFACPLEPLSEWGFFSSLFLLLPSWVISETIRRAERSFHSFICCVCITHFGH